MATWFFECLPPKMWDRNGVSINGTILRFCGYASPFPHGDPTCPFIYRLPYYCLLGFSSFIGFHDNESIKLINITSTANRSPYFIQWVYRDENRPPPHPLKQKDPLEPWVNPKFVGPMAKTLTTKQYKASSGPLFSRGPIAATCSASMGCTPLAFYWATWELSLFLLLCLEQ